MYSSHDYEYRRSSGCGTAIATFLIVGVIYLAVFAWYANTVIARPYPTVYTNFFWGLLHGSFAAPSFIMSLFSDEVTIYQNPNSGGWYNFGFLIGVGGLFAAAGSRNRS